MTHLNKKNNKTQAKQIKKESGLKLGIAYGLIPHISCILFIIFSILGLTFITSILRPLLLNEHFFSLLIGLSVIFATISAYLYLKKNSELSYIGIKNKKGYLVTLFGTTIGVNLLLFMLVMPVLANVGSGVKIQDATLAVLGQGRGLVATESYVVTKLKVDIPCPGHAGLIINELEAISGVKSVQFRYHLPNHFFDVLYNPTITSTTQILSLEVFETYQAEIISAQF